jgi:hypothetical protein
MPDKRPQDPSMDGTGLRFETMEHGGEYPDTMPQAIKLIELRAALASNLQDNCQYLIVPLPEKSVSAR